MRYVTSYGQRYSRVWENGRILYLSDKAEPGLWDNRWRDLITKEYYEKYERGELDELAPFAERVFGKEDRILEAGCGPARLVVALLSRGFKNVEGIDRGPQTVDRVRAIYPSLPVRVGDAMKVDRQDEHYDGYISLGVVEHRREGPEPFLEEAWRILRPGGHAFFSVPWINPLRNLKHKLGFFRDTPGGAAVFYQYAFAKSEFAGILTAAGFEVLESRGVGGFYVLQEELPSLFSVVRRVLGDQRTRRWLKGRGWTDRLGHMVLFVCRKPHAGSAPRAGEQR